MTGEPGEQFMRLMAGALKTEPFKLLDIGCSGGIDPRWRIFEPKLASIAIDADKAECQRLAEQEHNPDVSYVAAVVGPAGRPVDCSLYRRLSFLRAFELLNNGLARAPARPRFAEPTKPIVAPELLAARSWSGLDYLKIDVDGADFAILQSFTDRFETLGILAVQLEVNFVGTGEPGENSFHNTDRFMRRQGYELIKLECRNYSLRALPSRFVTTLPAQSVGGRPYQGEAYYARDPVSSGRKLGDDQLLKLAAIFSAWEQPDCAAEILLQFKDSLGRLIDIDRALDLLAAQTQVQAGADEVLSYRDYMAAFERQERCFYPPANDPVGEPTLGQRLHAAHAAYWDWVYAHHVSLHRERRR